MLHEIYTKKRFYNASELNSIFIFFRLSRNTHFLQSSENNNIQNVTSTVKKANTWKKFGHLVHI